MSDIELFSNPMDDTFEGPFCPPPYGDGLYADFLRSPSADVLADRVRRFASHTSRDALLAAVCVSCATENPLPAVEEWIIANIPNVSLLKPTIAHQSHELLDGLLLHTPATRIEDGILMGHVCKRCLLALRGGNVPVNTLASGMWVGTVPTELQGLTLVEQALIGLFPHTTYHVDFNNSRPHISSRSCHPDAVSYDVAAVVLPATDDVIARAFVIEIPTGFSVETRSFSFLNVRRDKVREGLTWLKSNNGLYRDVRIDEKRLRALPIDGIPLWILQRSAYNPLGIHDPSRCEIFTPLRCYVC